MPETSRSNTLRRRRPPGIPSAERDEVDELFAGAGPLLRFSVNAAEAREWPPRRRFTIGHELGHWVMHRTGQQSLFCREATVAPEETPEPATTRPPLPPREEDANAFAAALLMPARLIREQYARVRDHAEMCRLFAASGAAMGKRLHAVIEVEG